MAYTSNARQRPIAEPEDILSWTNQDCRESVLFNSWGILYRFETNVQNGTSVTVLLKRNRAGNKEERVARLEWSPTGGLGRVIIHKDTLCMIDIARKDPLIYGVRSFTGPDGLQYRWRPSSGSDIVLEDSAGNEIAAFRPTRLTRYQIGDVYGELHFFRHAGRRTVVHPPMQDMVTLTAMLYRFCAAWNV